MALRIVSWFVVITHHLSFIIYNSHITWSPDHSLPITYYSSHIKN